MTESELIITDQHDVNDYITFSNTIKHKRQIEIFKLLTELKDIKADFKFYFYKGTRNLVAKFLKSKEISFKMKRMNIEETTDDENERKKVNKDDFVEDEKTKNIKKKKKREEEGSEDDEKSSKKAKKTKEASNDNEVNEDDDDDCDDNDDDDDDEDSKLVNIKNLNNKKFILTFTYDAKIVSIIKMINKDHREYNSDKHTWKITNKKSMKELMEKFKSKKINYFMS
jgi:cobalamin biosynthesis protein CobT